MARSCPFFTLVGLPTQVSRCKMKASVVIAVFLALGGRCVESVAYAVHFWDSSTTQGRWLALGMHVTHSAV
jgi:hypothetical protein